MTTSVQWCDVVWRKEDGHVLRRALSFHVDDQMTNEAEKIWEKQAEERSMQVGLNREDTLCQSKCIVGVNQIATFTCWRQLKIGLTLTVTLPQSHFPNTLSTAFIIIIIIMVIFKCYFSGELIALSEKILLKK